MKKPFILIGCALVLCAYTGVAQADFESCEFDFSSGSYRAEHPVECAFYDIFSFPLSSTMMTSAAGLKEEYINEARDEAAAYVAADGKQAAGALLQETIQQIRSREPSAQPMTDIQISQVIMGDSAKL